MPSSRTLTLALLVPVAIAILIQLVPYGHDHTNPPAGRLVQWDSPRTQELARRACFDCHSNETKWPWYSSIAPISWRIQTHVREGREKLDFTAFDPANEDVADAAGEASETITKGEMPPSDYLLAHPEARLTPEEKQALMRGLDATFAAFGEGGEKGEGGAGGEGGERGERGEAGERGALAPARGDSLAGARRAAGERDRDGDRD